MCQGIDLGEVRMPELMGLRVWIVACLCALFFVVGCESATEEAPPSADVPAEVVDQADGDAQGPDALGECEIDDDCIGADLELGTCAKPVCDLEARVCVAGYADDGDLCEDGDACTAEDTCQHARHLRRALGLRQHPQPAGVR
jgi:hypothetical protein